MHVSAQTQSAEEYKRDDAASYDDVADRFEQYTERFTVPIAERLIGFSGLRAGARVLDVGCGTGVLSRLAATRAGSAGHVVGVDLSDGMLRKASSLAHADPACSRIEFRKGDAERLDLPDSSFDAVVSLYALRHFPNPLQALREMLRVARPGSTLTIGVGSAPPFGSVAFFEVGTRVALERLQALAGSGPLHATSFLDRLVERHAGPASHGHKTPDRFGNLRDAMLSSGCVDLRSAWIGQTSAIDSVENFWGVQVTLSTLARKAIPAMARRDALALRAEFDALCTQQLHRGGKLLYRSGALIVAGRRP